MMRRTLLALTISAVLGLAPGMIQAAEGPRCGEGNDCSLTDTWGKMLPGGPVETTWSPANTETRADSARQQPVVIEEDCGPVPAMPYAFRVSVDGVPTTGPWPVNEADSQRCADRQLARAEVQIRYDGMEATPWLNVQAGPAEPAPGGVVKFLTYSNYPAWIERAEVRLFSTDKTVRQEPLAVVPANIGETVEWTVPAGSLEEYDYVLRVYDKEGRFDETSPKRLSPTRLARSAEPAIGEEMAGYGENSRSVTNIPVRGGAVTVNGSSIATGQRVYVMGRAVPVDGEGRFAVREIMPNGPHQVSVAVKDEKGTVSEFTRNVSIADDDWFYVGLADFTLGKNDTNGPAKIVTADKSDMYDNAIYLDGRLAFYLKGKIKGKYLITAAADTREQPMSDLFSNFTSKDPRYLLRRLDPDRYYPVYGDDSTALEDAPTQGKFYVRVERGDSRVMWGNFQTSINGTDLAQYHRGLYGAQVKLVSEDSTEFGERRGSLEVFAADPGSLAGRDEFRGTGGSLYYLRRQDVTQGSERVWVEVRDKDTGLVLETRYLVPAQDYDIDYLQGRIILREPLASTAGATSVVRSGNFSGNYNHLVVGYEYTPGLNEVDDLVRGGRAQYWVNDNINFGLTGYRQDSSGARQRLHGADVTLRYKPGTYLKLEGAHSEGPGTGASNSIDGGFNFSTRTSPGGEADAHRIEAAVDFSDIDPDTKGRAHVFSQNRAEGFSAPGQITGDTSVRQQGAGVDWSMSESTDLGLKADERKGDGRKVSAAEANVKHELNDNWAVGLGVRADDRAVDIPTASEELNREGSRTDLALRMDYTPDLLEDSDEPEWSAYGFVQNTLNRTGDRSRNNRVGVGGERRMSKRFKLGGELSGGDGGLGALFKGDYRVDDRSNLYMDYLLDTDRTDTGYRGRHGQLTGGARTRYSDSVSVYGEERYLHGEGPSGLTHAFGVDLTPDEHWNYGFAAEAGRISDPDIGDMDRKALTFSLGYSDGDFKYAGNLEYRDEEGDNSDRTTWLMRNSLGYQVDEDWRLLGRLNFSLSESSQGNFFDGDFVEFVTGYAYRPVYNDRLNLLFKYTYFYNLPSPGQLTDAESLADYSQRSHVLSVDGTYDLKPWVSVGGKYAYRMGELRDNREGGEWLDSAAQLLVARADFHWVHEWDVLVEGRWLDVDAADDSRMGWLLGVYRHINNNVKAGIGYNFSDFSDDLTDLSYDSKGWFVNVVGKF